MAQLTVGDLIDRVYRRLHSVYSEEIDVINEGAAFATADTTLTLQYATTTLGEGDIIEVGQELIYVVSVSGNDATVIRGYMDTTAVQHADSSIVRINPRFSRKDISDALLATIRSWKDLYWIDNAVVNVDAHTKTNRGFAISGLPDDYKEIKKIRYENDDGAIVRLKSHQAWIERGFQNQTYLNMERDFYHPMQSGTVQCEIQVARPFVTNIFEETTLLQTQLHISENMEEVAVFGALWRLLAVEEGASGDPVPQAHTREREERPPGYIQQVALTYRGLHDARMNEEAARLEEMYG